jgi:acetolactate decarboxylase
MGHISNKLIILIARSLILFFSANVFAINLFQFGNASALISGATEGDMTYGELKTKGDFGLGTFNGIKGEMVALNGEFYHIGQNGKTTVVDLNWKTPYVELVNFKASESYPLQNVKSYNHLKKIIIASFNTQNAPYAIQIKGHFNNLELRSRSPRPTLHTKNIIEKKYLARDISGTLVGFWFPDYLLNLTLPGLHFRDKYKTSFHL